MIMKRVSKTIFLSLIMCALLISCSPKQKEEAVAEAIKGPQFENKESESKTILFFGNSLSAGYGLSLEEAFPTLIQEKIDSMGLDYEVINAGLSGETSASGNSRIDWVLKQHVDIMVLELGANDGLRGIPHDETYKNLLSIITKAKSKNPKMKILISSMEVPPNMGDVYANQFRFLFQELAEEDNVTYIPFILDGVAGIPELNLPDGIHPTAVGHKIVANNIWAVLKDELTMDIG